MKEKTSNKNISGNDLQVIKYAQLDMQEAYLAGYPGIIISGVVWLISGLVSIYSSPKEAIWTLLIGGMFIHPVSILVNKFLKASGKHAKDNPLGCLALEGTIFMIMCLPLAYLLSLQKVEWFFQGMLLIIGGRYLTYSTLYGIRHYWILGIALGITAYLLFTFNLPSHISVLSGAALELSFGSFMLIRMLKSKDTVKVY